MEGRGDRRALLNGIGIRFMINESPLPSSTSSRQSGRFSGTKVGATMLLVEDIIGFDPPPLMDENNIGGSKICSSPNEISEPTLT